MIRNILIFILFVSSIGFSEIVNFKADKVVYKMKGTQKITCLGHAVISNTNILIKAHKIVITGKNLDVAKCYKNVFILNYKSDIKLKSQYLEFLKKKDYIRLLKNPILEAKNLIIKADSLERYNKLPLSVVQGNVHIVKTNIDIYCSEGRYDEKNELIHLRGNPHVKVHKKDTEDQYYSGNIVFDNKRNMIIFSKNTRGIVYFDE